MSPERYARIKEIFLAASEQPPERRADYLLQACGNDAELQREVAKLLQNFSEPSHADPDRTAASGAPDQPAAPPPQSCPPVRSSPAVTGS